MTHLDPGSLAGHGHLVAAARRLVAVAIHRLIGAPLLGLIHDVPRPEQLAATGVVPGVEASAGAIVDDSPRRRSLAVDAAVAALRAELDQLFAREDLAEGRPFGTAGYEGVLVALETGAGPALAGAGPDLVALRRQARAAEERLRAALAERPEGWCAIIAAPGLLPGPRAASISLAFLIGLLAAMLSRASARALRRRRVHAAWAGLDRALRAWADAHLSAHVEAATDQVLAWLEHELRRRIDDRRVQREAYAAAHLRDVPAAVRALQRRPAYRGRPAGEARPGALLALRGTEWDALAAGLAPASPAGLLAAFARDAATNAAATAELARASAAEVRAAYRSWVRAAIAGELTAGAGLGIALDVLTEQERARRIRSLTDLASAPLRLRPGSAAEMELIAGLSGPAETVRPLADLLCAEARLEEVVETGAPDRLDLVAVSRGWLSAAEITDTHDEDARRLQAGLDRVHGELHSPQLALIAAECGMVEALFQGDEPPLGPRERVPSPACWGGCAAQALTNVSRADTTR